MTTWAQLSFFIQLEKDLSLTDLSVMIFFNVLPLLLLAVTGKQESVLEKRAEEAAEINYQDQGK